MEPRALLGECVRERRLEMGLSIDRAAAAAGMSATTWSRVEQAKTVQPLTYAAVERFLGWTHGDCRVIMNGGDPTPAGASPASPESPVPPGPEEPAADAQRYPHDPVLQHLWDTPDAALTQEDREALVQVYLALKRTRHSTPASEAFRPGTHAKHVM